MSDGTDEFVVRVCFCPGCRDEVFAEAGAEIECGVCNSPFIETAETVVVDDKGNVVAVN